MPQTGQKQNVAWQGDLFRLLADNVQDYAILLLDPQGRVLSWGSGAERLLGYREEEILGQPFDRFFIPEDRQTGAPRMELEQALATGRGEDERWHIRKDGSRFWSSGVTTPLRDGGGTLHAFAKIVRDRTDFKRTQDVLQELESQLDLAPLLVRDLDDRVVRWNQGMQHLYGWSGEQARGQVSHTLLQTRFPEPLAAIQATLLREGRWQGELTHIRQDGQQVTVASQWVLHRDQEGHPTAILEVNNDITAQKRAEQALAEANRHKDEFLAMLSHELRNSLAPVLNSLHIMRQLVSESPVLHQVRTTIERQVRQLARLVDDLLDVTRISKGKLDLRRERVELRAAVERAVEAVRPLIETHRHELTVSLPAVPVWLEADPIRLGQVLTNLLNNAVKYTESGGRISLEASTEGDWAVLQIRDNGVGIAPEMLPRVFDLFAQATASQARSQGGLGIGLTLVRRLVEMHGGTVEAASAGLGRGSEFTVRLPVLRPAVAGSTEAVETTRHDARPLQVLAVDDNVDAVDSLAMLLRLSGHEVQVAHTGLRALELAEGTRPDVVLLDLGLPGLDGFQVAERLRQLPDSDRVVLVALTGYGQEADRRRTVAAGFQHHLVKPVDPETLEQLLASLGAPRRQRERP